MATGRLAAVLGATAKGVKPPRWLVIALVGFALWTAACGGSQAPVAATDTYGSRIARCIPAPRPSSDSAQNGMIGVPAGQAIVGSSPQERLIAAQLSGPNSAPLFKPEGPRRQETLSAFRIDRTPVTNRAFAEFVAACGKLPPDVETITPEIWSELAQKLGLGFSYEQVQRFIWPGAQPHADRQDHPVVLVTHDDAALYCAWRGARLPTELEWERAARGTQGQLFPWGDQFNPLFVNTREAGTGDTLAVGSFDLVSSPIGAKDMGGLVFEWTDTPYAPEPKARVIKGNSWNRLGGQSRAAAFAWRAETMRDVEIGFRCADSR